MVKKWRNIKRDILEIIAASGEVFRRDLINVSEYTKDYIRHILGELRADNLIKENMFNEYRTIRLTNSGKKYLMQLVPGRFDRYLTGMAETNKLRNEPRRRERMLRMAQAIILLRQTKVKIFPDEKVLLYKNSVPPADKADFGSNKASEFYASTELKELFVDFNKSRGSRALGVLITASCVYIVYHTGMEPMKWQELTELKFRVTVENEIIRKIFKNQKELRWLVLGNASDLPAKLTEQKSAGKIKYMNILSDKLEKSYVEFQRESIPVLQLITDEVLCEKVETYIRNKYMVSVKDSGRFCEVNEAGNPVLLALNFNMQKINDFAAYLYVSRKQGCIICFDFQKQYLQSYSNAQLNVTAIDVRKYEEGMNNAKNN